MAGLLQQCCCCNLRKGSLCCGLYSLLLSMLSTTMISYEVYANQSSRHQQTEQSMEFSNGQEEMLKSLIWNIMTLLINGGALFFTSILLIVAIHREGYHLFMPWIIVMIMSCLLDCAHIIYFVTSQNMQVHFRIVQCIFWLISTLVNIYCILCVLSHYFMLKQGISTQNDDMDRWRQYNEDDINQVLVAQGPMVIFSRPNNQSYSPLAIYAVGDTERGDSSGKNKDENETLTEGGPWLMQT